MDWLKVLRTFGWLFFCLGMVQQQEDDIAQKFKRNFNIAYSLFSMHQRALVVTCRSKWGTQALGFPCLGAFIMMFLWYVATHDNFMLAWIGLWIVFQIKRRIEAVKLSGQIHSRYEGWPDDAMKFVKDEKTAKKIVEPVMFGILGGFLYWVYKENGLPATGLPTFLLAGLVTLPFIESVNRTMWERKLQGMNDAKIEQEALMEDFKNWR